MNLSKLLTRIKIVAICRKMVVPVSLLLLCVIVIGSMGAASTITASSRRKAGSSATQGVTAVTSSETAYNEEAAVGEQSEAAAVASSESTYNEEASTASGSTPSQAPQVPAVSISLNKDALTMNIGDKAALSATVSPGSATDKAIVWTSSDRYTVSSDKNGQLTAKQAGTAYIYATASNGVQAKCRVTVAAPKPTAVSSVPAVPAVQPAAPKAPPAQPAVKTFHGTSFNNSSQVIAVTANGMNTIYAKLNTYQKTNGKWNLVMSVDASVGEYGLVYDNQRIEGDLRTPVGVYSLPYAFGTAANPGTKLPYKNIDSNTYYDGQYGSPTYNNLVEGKPPNNEYEYMDNGLYEYGLDINFNPEEKPGKGNAIFLHCGAASGYTAGCVSISPGNVVKLLRWIDPAQKPMILICPDSDLSKYYY